MTHFRVADHVASQSLLEVAVRLGFALVLAQVFGPRIHQKYFQIMVRDFGVVVHTPTERSIATPHALILIDSLQKLRFLFWCDHIFDRNQHRTLVKIGANVFDSDRHSPMVPRTQIGGRIRKSGENGESGSRDGSYPGT